MKYTVPGNSAELAITPRTTEEDAAATMLPSRRSGPQVGIIMKTWFTIDGTLEPLDYEGPSFFRFPLELARFVVHQFSQPGDWILDPFCGFGMTLVAAQEVGRQAIGFEKDADRGAFAASRVRPPSRVLIDDVRAIAHYALSPFALLFTSPPYTSLREWNEEGFAAYLDDFAGIFRQLARVMRREAKVVIELSNIRDAAGVRPLLWETGKILATIFRLEGEIVRCNTGPEQAAPGFDHSTLVVLSLR